jgi:hypothetical protein
MADFFPILIIGIFASASIYYIREFLIRRMLNRKGLNIEATITGRWVKWNHGSNYYISYEYIFENKVISKKSENVSERLYRELLDKTTVPIQILGANPSISRTIDHSMQRLIIQYIVIAALFVMIAGITGFYNLQTRQSIRYILNTP